MNIEVGKCYYRKNFFRIVVKKVLAADNETVTYRFLSAPKAMMRKNLDVTVKKKNFKKWIEGEIEELEDYSHLEGFKKFKTYLVLTTKSEPIFRCNEKKAAFYLKKGHAKEISEGILQLTDVYTENKLKDLYDNKFSEFFLAVKNDKCYVCGKDCRLTRHHVIPQRHLDKLPKDWRSRLSNILIVCAECHKQYEDSPELDMELDANDPILYINGWRDHFIDVMKPKFLPKGWDLLSVKKAI